MFDYSVRESALVSARKDRQVVIRLPEALLGAIEKHRQQLQRERPFDAVSLATAVRDLLTRALVAMNAAPAGEAADTKPAHTRKRKPSA